MKKNIRLAVALGVAGVLVGCTADGASDEPVTVTTSVEKTTEDAAEDAAAETSEQETDEDTDPLASTRVAYNKVLDNIDPAAFTVNADYDLMGIYEYALVEMTGDDNPELLIVALTRHGLNPVKVYTMRGGEAFSPRETLLDGAASVGGSRVSLRSFDDGTQIAQLDWMSTQPEMNGEAYALVGDSITRTDWTWQGEMSFMNIPEPPGTSTINFIDVSDRSVLDSLGAAPAHSSDTSHQAGPQPTLGSEPEQSAAAPELTGTVRVLTAPELADLQGLDRTPNGEGADHVFAMLVLDSPQPLAASSSGGPGLDYRMVNMVRLGYNSPYISEGGGFDLDGQRVTMTFNPSDCWFPSDTSLPIGEPNCTRYTLE